MRGWKGYCLRSPGSWAAARMGSSLAVFAGGALWCAGTSDGFDHANDMEIASRATKVADISRFIQVIFYLDSLPEVRRYFFGPGGVIEDNGRSTGGTRCRILVSDPTW